MDTAVGKESVGVGSNETYLGDRRGKEQSGDGADELHNCGVEKREKKPLSFFGCVWMRGFVVLLFALLASPLPPFLVSHKVSRQKGCRLVQGQVIRCPRLVLLCLWCWGGFGCV